ncbi:MAG: hypothetical protein M3014_15425 [Chloroflexota bacterium]|nr:hypothetical protein [Chloroflexota bacterium]
MRHNTRDSQKTGIETPDEQELRAKIIDLGGYRAAEDALDALLQASPEDPRYPTLLSGAVRFGSPFVAAIMRRLDASRPKELRAFGLGMAHYPQRQEATQALVRASGDRRVTDNKRLGAILVLQYFLDMPPDETFLSTLREPARAVALLLTGALSDYSGDVDGICRYLTHFLSQPVDLLYSVVGVLIEAGSREAIEALRLVALQPHLDLSLAAIDGLAQIASHRAIQALSLLAPSLPPEPAYACARALQKLRLTGITIRPLGQPDEGCRALVTPIDGRGNRLIWLVAPSEKLEGKATLLCMLTNDTEGMVEAVGLAKVAAAPLSAFQPQGTLHPHFARRWGAHLVRGTFSRPEFAPLEVPYLYGLQLAQSATRLNWTTGTAIPLEYSLLGGVFWSYSEGWSPRDTRLQITPESNNDFSSVESDLLFTPYFESWYLESAEVSRVAEQIGALDAGLQEMTDESWKVLLPALIRLAHDEFSSHNRAHYAERLCLMSEWLHLGGHVQEASITASAARTLLQSPPEANLFVLRLVQKGILVRLGRMRGLD